MPAFVVDIGVIPRLFVQTTLSLPVGLELEIRHARHLGTPALLLGRSDTDGVPEYFAVGILQDFSSGEEGNSRLNISGIKRLNHGVLAAHVPNATIEPINSTDFEALVAEGNFERMANEEAPQTPLATLDTLKVVARQVARDYDNICGFSGVPVTDGRGRATPIRPIPEGGTAHASNFLFLHDEAATPFQRFAWTVGPAWEIIMDCSQVEQEVRETANWSGKLQLPVDPARWPQQAALAWHREQFLRRFR